MSKMEAKSGTESGNSTGVRKTERNKYLQVTCNLDGEIIKVVTPDGKEAETDRKKIKGTVRSLMSVDIIHATDLDDETTGRCYIRDPATKKIWCYECEINDPSAKQLDDPEHEFTIFIKSDGKIKKVEPPKGKDIEYPKAISGTLRSMTTANFLQVTNSPCTCYLVNGLTGQIYSYSCPCP